MMKGSKGILTPDTTDCYALRALAFLKTFEIRPIRATFSCFTGPIRSLIRFANKSPSSIHVFSCKHETHDLLTLVSLYNLASFYMKTILLRLIPKVTIFLPLMSVLLFDGKQRLSRQNIKKDTHNHFSLIVCIFLLCHCEIIEKLPYVPVQSSRLACLYYNDKVPQPSY